MATLMLEGGADIRYIQQMLGHANLDTTQIYTHVAIHTLKAVHAATHPGATLTPRRTETGDGRRERQRGRGRRTWQSLLDEDEAESEALPS